MLPIHNEIKTILRYSIKYIENAKKNVTYLQQNTNIFEHFNLANISTPYEQTSPKCGIKFKWIFLNSIKY